METFFVFYGISVIFCGISVEKNEYPLAFFIAKVYSNESSFCGAVAQLARAIRSHRIGRGFNSHLLHHLIRTGYFGQFQLEFQNAL